MKFKTVVLGLVAGLLVCLFAYHRVYRQIEKVRFKLLESPVVASADGTVGFRFLNPRPWEAQILAVRINNTSDQPKTFMIQLNEVKIYSGTVKKNSAGTQLVYVPPTAACVRCKLTVSSDHTQWGLQTVEVRNMFGFSSVWLKAVVVENAFNSYSKFELLELLLIFFLTFLLTVRLNNVLPSTSKLLMIPACIIIVSSAILAMLPFFSRYRILLSVTAFAKLWILCFLPVWVASYRTLSKKPNFKPILVSAFVATILTGGMLHQLREYDGNFSGFLHIAKKFLGRNHILMEHPQIRKELIKVEGNGYDGQFFYFIAWDPLMREYHFVPGAEKVIDHPVFRYRRILFPILTKIFSLNTPRLFPVVMMLLLIAGAALCGFFMAKTAMIHGWNGFGGLLCVLIPGLWFSLSVATPEPLAAAFLATGFFLTLRNRYVAAALFFSMATLTRESTILFILVFALYEFWKTRKLQGPAILVGSLAPYIVWRGYVTLILYAMNGWKGFFFEPATMTLPLIGVAETFRQIANGTYIQAVTMSAITLTLVLTCVLVVCGSYFVQKKHPMALIGAIYAFLAFCLSYDKVWKDVSNVERTAFESFLCLALLYISRSEDPKGRLRFHAVFILILVYDLFFMIRSNLFHAGLLWLFKS